MSAAVIRLEEHALDWLYALAHGVPPDQLRAEWAECDRAGAPVKARAYGWYWRHVTAGDPSLRPSGNQRALIRACALVDAARSGPAVQATAGEVQRAEEVTLDELAAQLGGVKVSPQSARGDAPGEPWGLCGDECGSTYAWMYMLAAVEMARCYRPASDVEWLAAALALKLRRWLAAFVALVQALDGRLIGPRSKRDSHPQVTAAAEALATGRSTTVRPVKFAPGSTTTNRGLYLAAAVDAALAEGAFADFRPAPLDTIRLRDPIVLERWQDGTTAAYLDAPMASYDNAQVAAVWGHGPEQYGRHPDHAFVPDRPITVTRQPGRLVIQWSGYERRNSKTRADLTQAITLPGGEPVSREVIG